VHAEHKPHFRYRLFATLIGLAHFSFSAMAGMADDIDVADGSGADGQSVPAHWQKLEDATVGFSLFHPPDWSVAGQVVSTQFADGARCRSVRFIDFEPPADSGAAAPMQQSFVQVCAKRQVQAGSLDQYMRRVYGDSFDRTFALVQLDGLRAFQAKDTGSSRTVFAEARNDLVQIIAAIATSPGKFSERQLQVQQILGSLQLK
jgi:hypothetical protein